jgi:hypothetical protein
VTDDCAVGGRGSEVAGNSIAIVAVTGDADDTIEIGANAVSVAGVTTDSGCGRVRGDGTATVCRFAGGGERRQVGTAGRSGGAVGLRRTRRTSVSEMVDGTGDGARGGEWCGRFVCV